MPKGALIGEGRIAEIYAWRGGQVLKLFREGFPDEWADYEAHIARTVHAAGAPAPAVGDVVDVAGRRGIIYERADRQPMARRLTSKPWTLIQCARLLAELHAAMHSCRVPDLPPLRRRLENKIHGAEPLSARQKEAALAALARLPDDDVLCHGDFHPDNVMLSSNRAIIIDWPDATRGPPLADVARTSLLLRVGGLPPGATRRRLIKSLRSSFCRVYLRRYFQLRPGSRKELAAWQLPVAAGRLSEGIAEETEQVIALVEASSNR